MSIVTNADFTRMISLRSRHADAPIDVTGWTAVMSLKRLRMDAEPAATVELEVFDGPAGRLRVSMAAALTRTLEPANYAFDIVRTDGGRRTIVADGRVAVERGVS